jgi:hypothetical protein
MVSIRPDTAATRVTAAYKPALLLTLALIAGCVPHPQPVLPPPGGFPPDFPATYYSTLPHEAVYRVVPERSSLLLKVYRTGPLASLGHNHVIQSHADGFIYLADDVAHARADLFVAVTGFVVDDAAARAAAGPDFATQPSASDIEGTRANMLGPKLLDAEKSPFIVVHVTPGHVGEQTTNVVISIRIREHVAEVPVDVSWSRSGNELSIHGAFAIDHATLGLEPFSALAGALRVADKIDVEVSLVAKSTK